MLRAASRLALAACAATGGRDAIVKANDRAAATSESGAYNRLTSPILRGPGLIDTPLIRGGKVGGGANPAAMQAMVDAHHAIPRIGQPAKVAAAIAFLASDDASFSTGSILPVDAGWTAA